MPKLKIFMPWYIADYLADTSHLNGPQHGAYLLLLGHEWRVGPMKNDIGTLLGVTRMEFFLAHTPSIVRVLLGNDLSITKTDTETARSLLHAWLQDLLEEFFELDSTGHWISPRLERERSIWLEKQERRVEKANKAIKARWDRYRAEHPQATLEDSKKGSTPSRKSADTRSKPQEVLGPYPAPSTEKLKSKYQRVLTNAGFDRNRNGAPASPKSPKSSSQPLAKGRRNPASSQHRAGGAAGAGGRGKGGSRPIDAAAVPKNSAVKGKKAVEQPPKTRNEVDGRFGPFREEVFRYWREIHAEAIAAGRVTKDPPWGPRERVEMSVFLASAPSITLQQFGHMLLQRARSQVNHAQPPYLWLKTLFSFATGAADRYGQLFEAKRR